MEFGEEANAEACLVGRIYAVIKRDFATREGFDYRRLNVDTQSEEFCVLDFQLPALYYLACPEMGRLLWRWLRIEIFGTDTLLDNEGQFMQWVGRRAPAEAE